MLRNRATGESRQVVPFRRETRRWLRVTASGGYVLLAAVVTGRASGTPTTTTQLTTPEALVCAQVSPKIHGGRHRQIHGWFRSIGDTICAGHRRLDRKRRDQGSHIELSGVDGGQYRRLQVAEFPRGGALEALV